MKRRLSISRNRGSALILTLLVVATLTGLSMIFSEDSSLELNLAGYSRDGYQAYQAARSGVHVALAFLNADENKGVDSLGEDWGQLGSDGLPMKLPEEVSASGSIADENGKLNLNTLLDEVGGIDEKKEKEIIRLFSALGLPENAVAPLLDWMDKDNIERMEGAESSYYQNLDMPYACPNAPFLTPGQIFLVKGMKEFERFGENKGRKLLDFLTVHSDGKINANTASREVLQCLSEKIDSGLAEAIVEYRKEQEFSVVGDLMKVAGVDEELLNEIKDRMTVKSSAFSIEIQGRSQDALSMIKAIALRDEDGLRLVYWQVM